MVRPGSPYTDVGVLRPSRCSLLAAWLWEVTNQAWGLRLASVLRQVSDRINYELYLIPDVTLLVFSFS